MEINKIYCGDTLAILKSLPDECVDCCITSPPYYGLRDYGVTGQIGLEKTPEEYVAKMVEVFREVKRVLQNDGTLWLNLGDSYAGSGKGAYADGVVRLSQKSKCQLSSAGTFVGTFKKTQMVGDLKSKDLIGIPWMVAFALRADGWYLRQDIIWHKPNPMPESVTDRCTKSHEYIFLFSKKKDYYFDHMAIKEKSVTYENRPNGIQRDREYGYDSKQDKIRVSLGQKSMSKGQAAGRGIEPSGNGKAEFYEVPTERNKRSVWTVTTKPCKLAHFATFPQDLISPMVLAGCPKDGIVLDPFMGAGTTAIVAKKLGRKYIGCEINPEYIKIAEKRIIDEVGELF